MNMQVPSGYSRVVIHKYGDYNYDGNISSISDNFMSMTYQQHPSVSCYQIINRGEWKLATLFNLTVWSLASPLPDKLVIFGNKHSVLPGATP